MMGYDNDNIFAKILRGEIPSHKICEDDETFAFMDIMPRGPGHSLVIPKKPARIILDVDPASQEAVMRTVQKVGRATMNAFDAPGLTIQQFNETEGGQVVFHLHVHVIPRFAGIALKPPAGPMEDSKILAENAAKISAALEAG
jgi:histidine triad (HIT) family protein